MDGASVSMPPTIQTNTSQLFVTIEDLVIAGSGFTPNSDAAVDSGGLGVNAVSIDSHGDFRVVVTPSTVGNYAITATDASGQLSNSVFVMVVFPPAAQSPLVRIISVNTPQYAKPNTRVTLTTIFRNFGYTGTVFARAIDIDTGIELGRWLGVLVNGEDHSVSMPILTPNHDLYVRIETGH